MPLLLGIDLGSSALKCTLIDEDSGFILTEGLAYTESWIGDQPDHLERNMDTYWEALKTLLATLSSEKGVDLKRIDAISFSVQGETFAPLDENFKPVRKTIQAHDVRATEETEILREQFGDQLMYQVTGQPSFDAYWPAVKMLWIKRHQPEVYAKARYFAMTEDYLAYKLTGRFVTDITIAGDSYYYDIRTRDWFGPMLLYLDIKRDMLPEVLETGAVIGNVSNEAAEQTGLSEHAVVVAGAMDQMVGAVGAGNSVPGIVTESTGTALALGATGSGSLDIYLKTGLPVYYHAAVGNWFLMPWSANGGLVLEWFTSQFGAGESIEAAEKNCSVFELMTAQAAEIIPGSEGLLLLPHLVGAAFPEMDSSARGVFFGINAGHTKAHFIRAVLESIAYQIRANIEKMRDAGIAADCLRSAGGGSKSPLWNQIKADVCGIPVTTMDIPDTASLGAALIAGVGIGAYPSFESTCSSRFIKFKDTYNPNPANRAIYETGFRKYQEIYQALKGHF